MASPRLTKLLIEATAKHLPPSASQLRLLDINGEAGEVLRNLRDDLEIIPASGDVTLWDDLPAESMDAVIAFDYVLNDDFLEAVHTVMRAGGRLIVVNSRGEVSSAPGTKLEESGYTRILVETAVECPLPTGVLMRGEKPHHTADTLERIQQVAQHDGDVLDLATFKGRYVHLLVTQTPNKPVWTLQEGEPIHWEALAVTDEHGSHNALAFSSLPKAVGFMQPAVLAGHISGINKVAKFSKETAASWTFPIMLNPPSDVLATMSTTTITIDPATAEKADE
ncbi:MAG: hypothetical protein RLP44_00945 [Aggregatilineales bacterium]